MQPIHQHRRWWSRSRTCLEAYLERQLLSLQSPQNCLSYCFGVNRGLRIPGKLAAWPRSLERDLTVHARPPLHHLAKTAQSQAPRQTRPCQPKEQIPAEELLQKCPAYQEDRTACRSRGYRVQVWLSTHQAKLRHRWCPIRAKGCPE